MYIMSIVEANQTSPSFEVNLWDQKVRDCMHSTLTPKTVHWLLLLPSYAELHLHPQASRFSDSPELYWS